MSGTRRRSLIRWGLAFVVAAGAAGAWTLHRVKTVAPFREGTLTDIPGLRAPVEILRDSLGVPHIFAESVHDLFLAQGWAHASDRLWQMDQFRRVSGGRLSEIFGEVTVETDAFLRTLALERAAARDLDAYPGEVRALLDAYAAGVNGALDRLEGPWPPEFVLLRFRPEPWEPVHSVGIEKVMALDLAAYGGAVEMARLRAELDDRAFAEVAPFYPDWGVTIVGDTPPAVRSARWARVGDAGSGTQPPVADDLPGSGPEAPTRVGLGFTGRAVPVPSGPGRALVDAVSTVRASNSWVVGPSRSRSGKPLLANDMHLALGHPNIWYLVGLHAPGYEVVGMSLPGIPGVVAGHSKAVAWGFTNASLDDADLFLERYDPADSTRYLTPDGSQPFEVREERVEVRDAEPVVIEVRGTRHGPVLADLDAGDAADLVSLAWVAHRPSRTMQALLGAGAARSASELVDAMRDLTDPHQNVVFADTSGAFGYWMTGTVPIRPGGRAHLLPVPGWTGEHDWTGTLDFEDHPHVLDPEAGFVATANNRQSRDSLSWMISDGDWWSPFRAERITRVLEARSDHDAASMLALQMDVESVWPGLVLPLAVEGFRRAGLEPWAERLAAWDGRADLESTEATLFHTWERFLRLELGAERLGRSELSYPQLSLARLYAEGSTDLVPLSARAAERAAGAGTPVPWGEAHRLTLDHPLAALPGLGPLFGFGHGPIPREGGPHTVNVASFGGSAPPFQVTHGPSQRHVVDLGDIDGTGGFILPGGQSGLPSHPNSFDQLARWRAGTLWLLPLDRGRVESRTVQRLRLEP